MQRDVLHHKCNILRRKCSRLQQNIEHVPPARMQHTCSLHATCTQTLCNLHARHTARMRRACNSYGGVHERHREADIRACLATDAQWQPSPGCTEPAADVAYGRGGASEGGVPWPVQKVVTHDVAIERQCNSQRNSQCSSRCNVVVTVARTI